jgi:hypothetical protein
MRTFASLMDFHMVVILQRNVTVFLKTTFMWNVKQHGFRSQCVLLLAFRWMAVSAKDYKHGGSVKV